MPAQTKPKPTKTSGAQAGGGASGGSSRRQLPSGRSRRRQLPSGGSRRGSGVDEWWSGAGGDQGQSAGSEFGG